MEDKRIFIKCVKPTICKHQMSDITEYHDGNYDIDVYCGLSKERIKCKQSTCKNIEYNGIPYSKAIKKMAKAMCNDIDGLSCEKCVYNIYDYKDGCKEYLKQFLSLAEAALNALLEE